MKTTLQLGLSLALVAAISGCKKNDDATRTGDTTTAGDTTAPAETTPAPAPTPPSEPEVATEEVTYNAGETVLKGFIAYPKGARGVAGVLVVHEWWGHNDYARSRARKLAEMGYTALAVDMYGDGKNTTHPADAKKFMTEATSDMNAAVARFDAARAVLQQHETTDPEKVSAIGYCFGGAVVLHMARLGKELDVVGSFHGVLATATPAEKGAIKGKLLVAHGSADPMVPSEQVDAFKKEMTAAGADLEFMAFEGAKHAFTNPGATELGAKNNLPLEYNEAADKASWDALTRILAATYP